MRPCGGELSSLSVCCAVASTSCSDDARLAYSWCLWCDTGFSIGIGGILGYFGAVLVALGLFRPMRKVPSVGRCSSGLCIISGVACMAALSIGVVGRGMVDGVLCAALWWGAVMVIGLLRGCFYKPLS